MTTDSTTLFSITAEPWPSRPMSFDELVRWWQVENERVLLLAMDAAVAHAVARMQAEAERFEQLMLMSVDGPRQ